MKKQEDEPLYTVAYKAFAELHPVEAFESDNEKFMELLKEQGYKLTIKDVQEIIKEIG